MKPDGGNTLQMLERGRDRYMRERNPTKFENWSWAKGWERSFDRRPHTQSHGQDVYYYFIRLVLKSNKLGRSTRAKQRKKQYIS